MAGLRPPMSMPTHARKSGSLEERPKPRLRKVLPEIWRLVRPRRWLLLSGLVLMAINRVSGLVLPASTKFLIDGVMSRKHPEWLAWIVGGVLVATVVQGITSYSLTQ